MVGDAAADLEIRRYVGESGSEKVRVRNRRLISSTVTFVLRSQPMPLFKVYSSLFQTFQIKWKKKENKETVYFIEDE